MVSRILTSSASMVPVTEVNWGLLLTKSPSPPTPVILRTQASSSLVARATLENHSGLKTAVSWFFANWNSMLTRGTRTWARTAAATQSSSVLNSWAGGRMVSTLDAIRSTLLTSIDRMSDPIVTRQEQIRVGFQKRLQLRWRCEEMPVRSARSEDAHSRRGWYLSHSA